MVYSVLPSSHRQGNHRQKNFDELRDVVKLCQCIGQSFERLRAGHSSFALTRVEALSVPRTPAVVGPNAMLGVGNPDRATSPITARARREEQRIRRQIVGGEGAVLEMVGAELVARGQRNGA